MNITDYRDNVVRFSHGWRVPLMNEVHLPAHPAKWDMQAVGIDQWGKPTEWAVGHVALQPGYFPCTFFMVNPTYREWVDAFAALPPVTCGCSGQRCPGPGPLYGEDYAWLPLWGALAEAKARVLRELKKKTATRNYAIVFKKKPLPKDVDRIVLSFAAM
jgi:hypothetical protein